MDCQMPVMDGFEATRTIRQDARFANLPILAMTANAMAGDKEKCVACGMNDHISKPIDVSQLFLTLAQWITPKQSGSDVTAPAAPMETITDGVPYVPGLDLKNALARVGGSVKLLRKLILRFRETQADVMSRIKLAMDGSDVETAVREAHTLKGLAGNIGAGELAARAGLVEGLLKRGETGGLADALHAMEEELVSQLARISTAMGEPEGAPTAPAGTQTPALDKDALAAEMRKLGTLLADGDSEAGDLAEKLAGQLSSLGQDPAVKGMLKQVANFEFDVALDHLKTIARALGVTL